jgi:translation elongation factor EF-G
LRGLGELHLDVVIERLRREFNLDVMTGTMSVAYRETVDSVSSVRCYLFCFSFVSFFLLLWLLHLYSTTLSTRFPCQNKPIRSFQTSLIHTTPAMGKRPASTASITLRVEPIGSSSSDCVPEINQVVFEENLLEQLESRNSKSQKADIGFSKPLALCSMRTREVQEAVQIGIEDAMESGVLMGCGVINVRAHVERLDGASDATAMAFRLCASNAFTACLKKAHPRLLEPVVDMEIVSLLVFFVIKSIAFIFSFCFNHTLRSLISNMLDQLCLT